VKGKGFCLETQYFGCAVDEVREREWCSLCAATDERYELAWTVGSLQPRWDLSVALLVCPDSHLREGDSPGTF